MLLDELEHLKIEKMQICTVIIRITLAIKAKIIHSVSHDLYILNTILSQACTAQAHNIRHSKDTKLSSI